MALKKSWELGKTLEPAKITGAIWVDNEKHASGVALDPYTILTAAHIQDLDTAKTIKFKLAETAQGDAKKGEYFEEIQKVIIHDSFKSYDGGLVTVSIQGLDGIPYSKIEDMTFDEFQASIFYHKSHFNGVDLAILKLEKPLPLDLKYPEFINIDEDIDGKYGISIGYGVAKSNDQERGPQLFDISPYDVTRRHVISCKVWKGLTGDGRSVLYGKYHGLLINGDESFIPSSDMMKTEGLPVNGDSGGPLFIKVKEEYKLAGIFSISYAPLQQFVEMEYARKFLKNIKQPIFPNWHTISPYLEWIKSNMGPSSLI